MNLIHTINDSDITLTHKPRLLGRKLPTNKWFDSADGPTRNALGRLKAISVDDGEADESVIWAEDEIRLSHKTVAGLTESESRALGFPPATPVALRLETQDQIKIRSVSTEKALGKRGWNIYPREGKWRIPETGRCELSNSRAPLHFMQYGVGSLRPIAGRRENKKVQRYL